MIGSWNHVSISKKSLSRRKSAPNENIIIYKFLVLALVLPNLQADNCNKILT